MKAALLFSLALYAVPSGVHQLRAQEAKTSLYVVDRLSESSKPGGICIPYAPQEATGEAREILAMAKGPAGSTILMIAFDGDSPHLGLAPVVAAQGEDTAATRFPVEGGAWPYDSTAGQVDLYVVVFEQNDPELAKISEYAEWLSDAIREENEVDTLLHAEAVKRRLTNLLRRRGAADDRVKFGDQTTVRLPPSSMAAVTRGTSQGPQGEAAGHRMLDTIEAEWPKDSRPIPFEPGMPGVLVFPISTPPSP